MERIELVEKLTQRANIGVEEARDVLEKNNWDILDAMVELERAGKISGAASASSKSGEEKYEAVSATASGKNEKQKKQEKRQAFKEKVKKGVRVLLDNKFVIKNKDDELLVRVPIIVPIICLLAAIWLTVILIIVGMICGLKFSFEGKELGKEKVNDGVNKVSEAARNIVDDIKGMGSDDTKAEESDVREEESQDQ